MQSIVIYCISYCGEWAKHMYELSFETPILPSFRIQDHGTGRGIHVLLSKFTHLVLFYNSCMWHAVRHLLPWWCFQCIRIVNIWLITWTPANEADSASTHVLTVLPVFMCTFTYLNSCKWSWQCIYPCVNCFTSVHVYIHVQRCWTITFVAFKTTDKMKTD